MEGCTVLPQLFVDRTEAILSEQLSSTRIFSHCSRL